MYKGCVLLGILSLVIAAKMPGCAAVGCSNSAKKGFVMKVFPRDPKRRQEWAEKAGRENWFPTNFSVLCEVNILKKKKMYDKFAI